MKLNTLNEPQRYGAWVCRIAKNCAVNMLTRFQSFMPLEAVENQHVFADSGENPAELYARSEKSRELHKSIGKAM